MKYYFYLLIGLILNNTISLGQDSLFSNLKPKVGLVDTALWDPPSGTVFIDPGNAGDLLMNGSLKHPFSSLAGIKWQSHKVYAIKRGTRMEEPTIVIFGDDIILATYGNGDRPIISSKSIDYALETGWNGNNSLTIRDLEIIAPHAVSAILFRTNSKDVRVIHCKLHGSQWGLRVLNNIQGLYVYNTEIFDTYDDGIFIKLTAPIEISHCYIHRVNLNWKPPSTSETIAGGDGIQFEQCNHWKVNHNIIDRSEHGNKFCFISNNPLQDDGIFEYNILRGPLVDGFSIYIGDGHGLIFRYNDISGPSESPFYSHATNLKIYCNIFRNISGPLFVSQNAEIYNNVFYHIHPIAIQGGKVVVRNNIFDLGSLDVIRFKVEELTEDHNLFAYGLPTNGSYIGKPMFEDPLHGNFHLKANSACRGKGVPTEIIQDMDGNKVSGKELIDIGPFQF